MCLKVKSRSPHSLTNSTSDPRAQRWSLSDHFVFFSGMCLHVTHLCHYCLSFKFTHFLTSYHWRPGYLFYPFPPATVIPMYLPHNLANWCLGLSYCDCTCVHTKHIIIALLFLDIFPLSVNLCFHLFGFVRPVKSYLHVPWCNSIIPPNVVRNHLVS
jgi:hypothetical protein